MPKPIKYSRFKEVVKNLINDHYNRSEVSESEMEVIESKLIEYAVDGNYNIYVRVACYGLSDYFELTCEDLLRFVEKPRAGINIEKLRLYTMAKDVFSNIYYEVREPDEHGIFLDYQEVSKTSRVSTKRFRIKEEDLSLLKEAIDSGNLDLNVKLGEGKTSNFEKNIKPNPLFMDDSKNILYFNKEKPATLNPEEIKLIKYMCKQDAFGLEQILTEHFKIKPKETYKHSKNIGDILPGNHTKPSIVEKIKAIDKGDRNKFDVYKTNINKKCKLLEIGDLIIRHEKVQKVFKLSINIKKKPLKL